MTIDAAYTQADHAFRDLDPYAKAKYDLTLRWLRGIAGRQTVLYNIGCGSGYFNALASQCCARVVACEPDPEAYERAVRRTARGGDGVEVLNCGLGEFARARAPADVVVMHDVLEHIDDDRSAAATLAGLVRPGGIAVVSVPAYQAFFGLHDELLGHYRRYGVRQLRALLEPHFRIERLRQFGMLSIPLVLWFSRWRRRRYPVGAAGGWLGKAYAALCAAESYVPEPVGTSILVYARR
jgi:SAM-dependent methyltransferase